MRFPSLHDVVVGTSSVVRRFPLEMIIATCGTIAAIVWAVQSEFGVDHSDRPFIRIVMAAILIFSTSLAITISYEARRFAAWLRWVSLTAAGALAAWFTIHYTFSEWETLQYMVGVLAAHTLVAVAAMWNRDRLGFWDFNRSLFLRMLTALFFTAVLGGGLNIAIVAIKVLFDAPINGVWYGTVWAILLGVFNTAFVLSALPPTPNDPSEVDVQPFPRSLLVFVQYVLIPLVVIFLVILYAYIIKVMFFSSMHGRVATFIIVLAVGGLLSYVLLYPLRSSSEHPWVKLYTDWFSRLMLPLITMLWVALFVRVADHGITEQRYATLAIAACLTVIFLVLSATKNADIRTIPATFLLACFVAVAGPWGMVATAYRSQCSASMETLTAATVIGENGYSVASARAMKEAEKLRVAAVVRYMHDYASSTRMQRFLSDIHASSFVPDPAVSSDSIIGLLGVESSATGPDYESVNFYTTAQDFASVHQTVNGSTSKLFELEFTSTTKTPHSVRIDCAGTWTMTVDTLHGRSWILRSSDGEERVLDLSSKSIVSSADFTHARVTVYLASVKGIFEKERWLDLDAVAMLTVTPK